MSLIVIPYPDCGFSKHMRSHQKQVKCQANSSCPVLKADERDMHRHYWVEHKPYAEMLGIPEVDAQCELCGETFSREDNMKKHVKKVHKARA